MAKTNSPNTPNKYYFYEEASKIVYYSDFMPEEPSNLIYIGTSDNPNYAMAGAVLMKNTADPTGYRLRELLET